MARGNQVVSAAKREIEKLEKEVAKLDERRGKLLRKITECEDIVAALSALDALDAPPPIDDEFPDADDDAEPEE